MDKQNNTNKVRGNAMQSLRAFIHALTIRDGKADGQERYRYEINDAAGTARIFDVASGQTVDGFERSLDDWAKEGRKVRLAFIGLWDAKIALDEEARQAGGNVKYVRFALNVLNGEAVITRNGENVEGKPTTIDEWAKIGREVEKPLFESLKAAQEYGSEAGVRETREKMIARRIIRAPREDKKPAQK